MGIRRISVNAKPITQRLANEFASMTPAPQDRPMSKSRMEEYERIIRADDGMWRPCTWARATCLEDGGVYRVNGKHTSTLFSTLVSEFPNHFAYVETYECDTLEDVAHLYATFDSKLNSRSQTDINHAFAGTIEELAGVKRPIINAAATGMNMLHCGGNHNVARHKSAIERAEVILECPEFVIWLNRLFGNGDYKKMLRQGVVCGMYATWLKCRRDAEEFWTEVRDETGTSPSNPTRQLARFLLVTSAHNKSGDKADKQLADSREFYYQTMQAWNAFRKEKAWTLRRCKRVKYDVPVAA